MIRREVVVKKIVSPDGRVIAGACSVAIASDENNQSETFSNVSVSFSSSSSSSYSTSSSRSSSQFYVT